MPSTSPLFVPFKNGFNAVLGCCLHVMSKRSKVLLTKTVTLTVRANEPQAFPNPTEPQLNNSSIKFKQEYIPVGCVPPAAVVVGEGGGLVLIPLNFPLGCWPGPDSPEFPPWVWAWIWSYWISPLDVGLDLIPLNFPPGCGPGGGGVSLAGGCIPACTEADIPLWTEWQTGAKILPCPKLHLRAVNIQKMILMYKMSR